MEEKVTLRKTFNKTLECPKCKQLISIKFRYTIEVEDFDIYKVIG